MRIPRIVVALAAFLFVGIIAVALSNGSLGQVVKPPAPEPTAVPTPVGPKMINLLVTGDKVPFLEDERTKQIALDNGYVVNYTIVTSLGLSDRMINHQVDGYDGGWITNDISLEKLKQYDEKNKNDPNAQKRSTFFTAHPTTFSTVLVIYTWDKPVDAYMKAGLVEKQGNTYYARDLLAFEDLTLNNVTLADPRFGQPGNNGEIRFSSSDPLQGDSGMMWAGLVTTDRLRAHGQIQQIPETINPILPEVNRVLGTDRFQQPDTQVLFERFFRSPGSSEMIVGYESQLYEFIANHPQDQEAIKSRLRIVYPPQTVWSFNPFIALSRNGSDFANLLERNNDMREVACAQHGYRVYTTCAQRHPEVFAAWGMPEELPSATGVPSVDNMDLILGSMKPKTN